MKSKIRYLVKTQVEYVASIYAETEFDAIALTEEMICGVMDDVSREWISIEACGSTISLDLSDDGPAWR